MTLLWEDERYVRVYTRDTVSWKTMPWEARALFLFLLRKVDRAGLLDLGRYGVDGVAVSVDMPLDATTRAIDGLVKDGCIEIRGQTLVVRNFIEAQESVSTPASRQRDSRERRRDMIRRGLAPEQRGCVIYFIQSEHGGPIKIGQTQDVAHRLMQLQTSRPDKLIILAAVPGTLEDERAVHALFSDYREKGEWFSPTEDLVSYVKEAARTNAVIRDWSHSVTGHSVPIRSVPIRTVPKDPPKPASPAGGELFSFDKEPLKRPETSRRKSKGDARPKQPTRELLKVYCDEWVKTRRPTDGRPPELPKADIKAASKLLAAYGLAEASSLVLKFLGDDDKFLIKNGHALRFIDSRVSAYRATAGPASAAKKYRNFEDARPPIAEGEKEDF